MASNTHGSRIASSKTHNRGAYTQQAQAQHSTEHGVEESALVNVVVVAMAKDHEWQERKAIAVDVIAVSWLARDRGGAVCICFAGARSPIAART